MKICLKQYLKKICLQSSALDKLSKLRKQDKSLYERIKYFISNLASKIKKLYEGLKPDSAEARYLSEMNDTAAKLQQMFNDALYDASIKYSSFGFTPEDSVWFSIKYDPNTNLEFVNISINDIIGEGIEETDSISRKARLFLNKRYKGIVLPVGRTKNVYIRKEVINETTNPAKKIENSDFRGKMLAITELDNLLKSSKYLGCKKDDGRHPDVKRWINYRTTFLFIDENGKNQVIQGTIRIKRIARGDCFYDITEIKNITNDNIGQSIINAAESEGDVYNNRVSQADTVVNSNSMQGTDENTQFSLKNSSSTLTDRILDYISAYEDFDALSNKNMRKYRSYTFEEQSRLTSSIFSAKNLDTEMAADFLT